jgi:hypothetical protein
VNTGLQQIDLSYNEILEEEELKALAQALKKNTKLLAIALEEYDETLDEDAKSFRTKIMTDVLASNFTLLELVGVEGVDHLMQRNKDLRRARRAKVTRSTQQFRFPLTSTAVWSCLHCIVGPQEKKDEP